MKKILCLIASILATQYCVGEEPAKKVAGDDNKSIIAKLESRMLKIKKLKGLSDRIKKRELEIARMKAEFEREKNELKQEIATLNEYLKTSIETNIELVEKIKRLESDFLKLSKARTFLLRKLATDAYESAKRNGVIIETATDDFIRERGVANLRNNPEVFVIIKEVKD